MKKNGYKHFIITRFNVVTKFSADKSGNKTQTEEWLNKRFQLFDWFCFPSIANQSVTDFKWLVLFSINTPDFYKDIITQYTQTFPAFVPVYLNDGENTLTRIVAEIDAALDGSETHVITTRIDNDDSFHEDMVKLIRKGFENVDNGYLNFDNGLQYDIDNHVLCEYVYKNNAFTSRIEELDGRPVKTVYEKRHDQLSKADNVKYIKTKPSWLQIIHEGNVYNNLRISRLLFSTDALNAYHLQYPSKISTVNSLNAWVAYNFARVVKKVKRTLKIKSK